MNSETLYNPEAGKTVNENPHRTFYPLTEQSKQEAQDRLQAVIDYSRRALDPLSDNED